MKAASQYLHPRSGQMQQVPPRWHVRFLMSPTLKSKLRARTE